MVASRRALLAALTLLAGTLGGCARQAELPPLGTLPEPPPLVREAYAYIGPLLSLHPMYPAVKQLQLMARELARGTKYPVSVPPAPELPGALTLSLPDADRFQADSAGLAPEVFPAPPRPVLQAAEDPVLRWREANLRRKLEYELIAAQARERGRIAELRAKLVREAQLALDNIGLQVITGQMTSEEADRLVKQITDRIEDEVLRAEREAQARLSELEQRLNRRFAAELSKLRSHAGEELEVAVAPWPAEAQDLGRDVLAAAGEYRPSLPSPEHLQVRLPSDLLSQRRAKAVTVTAEQKRQLNALRQQAARRLWRSAEAVAAIVRRETAQAARAAALAHGYVLYLPPTEPKRGIDATARCRKWLQEIWQ